MNIFWTLKQSGPLVTPLTRAVVKIWFRLSWTFLDIVSSPHFWSHLFLAWWWLVLNGYSTYLIIWPKWRFEQFQPKIIVLLKGTRQFDTSRHFNKSLRQKSYSFKARQNFDFENLYFWHVTSTICIFDKSLRKKYITSTRQENPSIWQVKKFIISRSKSLTSQNDRFLDISKWQIYGMYRSDGFYLKWCVEVKDFGAEKEEAHVSKCCVEVQFTLFSIMY